MAVSNKPPVTIYTVDSKVVTLPDNDAILDLSASYDPEGKPLTYTHKKTAGPSCTIAQSTAAVTKVTLTSTGKYTFEGTTKDNKGATSKKSITIELKPQMNKAPVVIYTVDKNQVTLPDKVVTLNLDASYDPESKPLASYRHVKVTGTAVTFENQDAPITKVTLNTPGVYQFRGIVTDDLGLTSRATLSVELKEGVNLEPVAIYTATANAIISPQNEVDLSLAASYDPDDRALKTYLHEVVADSPPCTILTPNQAVSTVRLTTPGKYIFKGTVGDDRGGIASSTVTVEMAQQIYITLFGCKFQNLLKAQNLNMLQKFGMMGLRPNGETVSNYRKGYPAADYKYFYDQGIKMWVNVGWQIVQENVIRRFPLPSELQQYADKLRMVFDDSAKYWEGASCENEPTNDGYFGTAPIENYIEELRVFASICKEYGLQCADGAVHIGYLEILRTNNGQVPASFPGNLGNPKEEQNHLSNVAEVKAIIEAEAGMPDVTFSNFHHELNAGTPKNIILNNANYLKSVTGKRLICNEFSMNHVTDAVLQQTVSEMRQLNLKYANIWGGNGWPGEPPTVPSEFDLNDIIWKLGLRLANLNDEQKEARGGDAINLNTDVTTVGDWYRNAAKFTVKESTF